MGETSVYLSVLRGCVSRTDGSEVSREYLLKCRVSIAI